ncbi:MAG: G1/S-specific cyclin cln3, partial [Pleopsidium flavum]
MLPLPGAPASSWAMYRARFKATFDGADARVCIAFWLFGLINNVLYVIILSAALDLVGPGVPKSVVLLADVIPSFLMKLCAPYFIHVIPYPVRIILFVILSMWGMLLIALTPAHTDGGTISTKMVGVVLASLSSGGGELSFLGLTHFYGPFSLAAWGSGTGGAGLIGAGAYAVATTSLGLSVKTSLLTSSLLPIIMLLSFFFILPRGPLKHAGKQLMSQRHVPALDEGIPDLDHEPEEAETEHETLLTSSAQTGPPMKALSGVRHTNNPWMGFRSNLKRSSTLFFPYMLPLLLVYIAEYTINQGVAPTLLFSLRQTPFKHYRAFYPTYNAIYQVGVFISRSSILFFRIHNLYAPSFLQMLNLALLTLHALFNFIPNVYIIFVIVFWEGLLGGLVYVNTFAEITDGVRKEDREFSLGATSDKDGRLIPRNAQSQQAFDMSLARIKRNWNLDALSAIPDIDGLRPAHIDTVTVDFVRYLGYISHYEKDVKVVQASMIDEQNRRVESKKIIEEKDKLLKLSDLKNIHERYKRDLVKTPKDPDGESLQDDDTEGRRTETGHTELPGGETDDSTLSILNSEDFRSLEGSSGRSSTTIHSTVYVEQPDQSEFYSLREKRPRSPDANDPQAVTKRVKILDELYHACQQPQENEKLSWAPKELARPSSRTPKHDRTLTPIEQAASKSAGFDERLARAKTLADQVGLLDRQPVEGLPDVGYRSNSYDYITPSTPSVSSLSDGPARPLIAQSFPENPTQPKDPSHHMLDKMTTNFTDNLFFLHGVLRTFADTGSGRASGEALDLAAGDVLEALKIFRRRVELIIEGDITQPFLVEQQTAPVIQGNSS